MSGGAPPLSTWLPLDLLAFELDTALAIQRWRMSRSYQHTVNKLLSPHPLHDASVVTLIVLLFTVPFAGYTLLWCALASFGSCFIWDKLVHAHTPRALDPRIIALSNVSPGGFPCFEIVLAASVFISIGWVYPSPGIQLAVILLFLALCLLKVWSTSYFLYSQFLSVVWGLAISAVVHSLGDSLPTQFTTRTAKLAVGCCGLLALLALLAYRAEYNAAPIFRIPRSDWLRFAVVRVLELVHHGPEPSR